MESTLSVEASFRFAYIVDYVALVVSIVVGTIALQYLGWFSVATWMSMVAGTLIVVANSSVSISFNGSGA